MAKTSGIVSIHGKDYATVAYRLELFRQLHPDGLIRTELIKDEDGVIIMKAWVYSGHFDIDAVVDEGVINRLLLGSDYAEEVRGSSNINKTSALENASTSAVGRALAYAGFGSAESIASADEVTIAIERQKKEPAKKTKAKLTKEQRTLIESFLDECSDGDLKLQRLLDWGCIDNLSNLTKDKAKLWITKNMKVDIKA